MAGTPGCLDRPIEPVEPRTTTTIVERLVQSAVDKIDILLAIDNSRSMADKQEILNLAVPDLVSELVNPWCLHSAGEQAPERVGGPLDECPEGFEREFKPIVDIHIGIITSSLGDVGGDVCPEASAQDTNNDLGHLVTRDVDGNDVTATTYQGMGFLAWDPTQKLTPPGETNVDTLIANVQTLVGGAGEMGCGFEAQLESWYRFLIDPEPWATVELNAEGSAAVVDGIDTTIVNPEDGSGQRADFMRPDSLLAIIMLSDENDCSIRAGGQYFYAAKSQAGAGTYHLPRAQSTCATAPNDPCCRSCGQSDDGCPPKGDECATAHDNLSDQINLRCFDQKRRFGIDFLYPIERYVTGLTSSTVPNRSGELVANPVFSDLNPNDEISNVRDPGLVFVAGIVGVPWQDIARQDGNDQPDLLAGLNAEGEPAGGFQSGNELIANGTWDIILGDPTNYVDPTDPLMMESVEPRSGTNPVTGDAVAPPDAGYQQNPINGHEWTISERNDLQYACTFPLTQPLDCAGSPAPTACDCLVAANDKPLCEDPSGTNGQTQYFAKAYPGRRELHLLKNVGNQGIVASICPAQQDNTAGADFGYRPAVKTIVERLKQALGGQCLPRSLTPDENGQVSCLILEALRMDDPSQCTCDGNGRQPVSADHQQAVEAATQDPLYATAQWNCFCEITQVQGDELQACQNEPGTECPSASSGPVHGWCYVDATTVPTTGHPDIVANCPENEKRIIRFACDGKGQPGATLFITCSGE